MSSVLLFLILGLGVGLVSSVLGLGGGILIVPLLSFMVEIPHKEVVATSLATIFLVASMNSIFFYRQKLINIRAALSMGPATSIGALIGASLAFLFSDDHLRTLLLVVLIVFIFKTLFKNTWDSLVKGGESDQIHIYVFWGLLAGVLSGLTGIGSGVIIVPVLLGFSFMESSKVTPTANAVMVFTTFAGALRYAFGDFDLKTYKLGFVHFDIAALLFIGAFCISFVGRKYQHKLSSKYKSLLLGAVLCFMSYRLIVSMSS